MYPVVDEAGRLAGCVTTRRISELPREEWDAPDRRRPRRGAATPENTVPPPAPTPCSALSRMSRTGASRLLVVEGDRLLGILSLKDLLQFFALKMELEEGK